MDVSHGLARALLQFPPLPSPTINTTGVVGEFTDFTLSTLPGGVQVGLVISIATIVIGFVLMFFGARLFKYTLFILCFMFGAALGYFVARKISPNPTAGLITAGVLGLLLGGLAVKLWKLALFVLGAGCGFILWVVFKALFPSVLNTDVLLYGVLTGSCLVLGLIAMKMEKIWLLLGTPLLGTFFMMQGISAYVPEVPSAFQLLDTVEDQPPWDRGCFDASCYALYSMVLGGSVLGFIVQYRFTSEYGQKRMEKDKIRKEARAEYEDTERERRKYRKG